MPWGRLDDSLYDHQKLDELPTDAADVRRILDSMDPAGLLRLATVGLFARSISWSNRFLTDGLVARRRIEKLDGSAELADAMVAVGMLERSEGGYLVHDFGEYNELRAEVEARRQSDRDRQAEYRKNHPPKRRGVSHAVTPNGNGADVTAGVTPLVTAGVTAGVTAPRARRNPGPSRPGPSRPVESPPPPAERGQREDGTNPRALGEAPRQVGSNPRAQGSSPRQEHQAEKTGPTKLGDVMAEIARRQATTADPDDEPRDRGFWAEP